MERRKVTTPKEFFIKERNEGYGDWTLSFWRELFQNSVDAGARRIDIDVRTVEPRGSFDGKAPALPQVVRVVFADDGCGMTKDILENVYFTVGATTKGDGSSIGGFGRARLMTCFSNVRYSILTRDRFVIGDGAEWVGYGLDEAESEVTRAIDRLSTDHSLAARQAVEGLRSDLEMLRAARAAGGVKGCRVEIDLDPESGDWSSNKPTESRMLDQLRLYLSESQLVPSVTINGQTPEEFFGTDGKLQARRGPALQRLSAQLDGETIEFASVHVSGGEKANHKRKVIVRVDGASMFTMFSDVDKQVIVEVDPELSRKVLTANRDGMTAAFSNALQDFLNKIAIDPNSSLKHRRQQSFIIPGERGRIRAFRPAEEETRFIARRKEDFRERTVSQSDFKGLAERIEEIRQELLTDLNDVFIHVENTNPAIKAAIRRNDPRNWDMKRGKGKQPWSLLVAWTQACAVAVETLMKVRPGVGEFEWITGWCYDTPQMQYQGDGYRDSVAEAMHIDRDQVHAFLVNPVDENGKLQFSVGNAEDRQRLQALAMHEVAHVVQHSHNETYAGILTDLMKEYDFREAHRRMKEAVKAIHAAFDQGKARIQAMDDEPSPRPADRLLSIAAPLASAQRAVDGAITYAADGTRVVDCDAVAAIEVSAALRMRQPEPSHAEAVLGLT